MVRHGRNKKRRAGRIGKVKLKNKSWNRWDPNPKLNKKIKDLWDVSQSPAANLERMGLVAKPNQLVGSSGNHEDESSAHPKVDRGLQANVIEVFDVPESDKPSRPPLNEQEEAYMVQCMAKHGDDYTSMFRDVKGVNPMQYTEHKLRKMGSRFLLLSPEQRRLEVPENVKHLLPDAPVHNSS